MAESSRLIRFGYLSPTELLKEFGTSPEGLTEEQAAALVDRFGFNEIVHEARDHWPLRLLKTFNNPLIILLSALAVLSVFTSDISTAIIIAIMVLVSVLIRYYQEEQAYTAARHLKAMVKTTCTVVREGKIREIDLRDVVPGDIVQLAAGDIVPADARLLSSKELFVNQSLLTGESLPVEKHAKPPEEELKDPLELRNLVFTGTNVESGAARAVVLTTGAGTYFGRIAKNVVGRRVSTSFDTGVNRFTWLMISFMLLMTPIVFFVNGFFKHDWWEAFLFAVAVAVGLTPEMLPAIVTVNLSKGAITMSKKKVIVKRLSSIQNFGAMDVLCTDKTGTLTQNKIVLIENLNINGENDPYVLELAYVNSRYQTGFKNLLDEAVLTRGEAKNLHAIIGSYKKIDELPFDFVRRRLSVVAEDTEGETFLICKGAVHEVLDICTKYELKKRTHPVGEQTVQKIEELDKEFSKRGFRVIAVAYRKIDKPKKMYSTKDEHDMTFLGFMTFFDPPKESAAPALKALAKHGVDIKVLTGDNDLVTKKICKEVGLRVKGILFGSQIEPMSEEELGEKVEHTTIFAKLSPDHKRRVVNALQQNKHVVGYLGDGINDAPALRAADVGISVDSAVDIAKESADIILLEMSLLVLGEGVIEGRRVFGNITKYIKMGASSNFGNMFSVLGASVFLPFLPMTPLQLLTNNLLYDISQTAIPTDTVDEEYVERPRRWEIGDIRRFMVFMGPVSSVFDYATFGVMLYAFHAWSMPALFQTGWFVESLLTQTLIVHVIRSRKIPFLETRASKPLLATTLIVMGAAVYLVHSRVAHYLGFMKLPLLYWPILALILFCYVVLAQVVKTWYIKKFGYN